jgi:hypothetical protein
MARKILRFFWSGKAWDAVAGKDARVWELREWGGVEIITDAGISAKQKARG